MTCKCVFNLQPILTTVQEYIQRNVDETNANIFTLMGQHLEDWSYFYKHSDMESAANLGYIIFPISVKVFQNSFGWVT